jgi:hypothetical protein
VNNSIIFHDHILGGNTLGIIVDELGFDESVVAIEEKICSLQFIGKEIYISSPAFLAGFLRLVLNSELADGAIRQFSFLDLGENVSSARVCVQI